MSLPPVSPAPPPATPPTWQELTKFIDEQNQKTRNTIDFWYKLAAGLLGVVLIAATFVGWKTVADAKEAAVRTATETARAAVEKKLSEPAIQQLVHDTAIHMLETGEFKKDVQEEVHTKLPSVVGNEIRRQVPGLVDAKLGELGVRPRTISTALADQFRERLKRFAGKRVVIQSKSTGECIQFADRVQEVLSGAQINIARAPVKRGSVEDIRMVNMIEASNPDLGEAITSLIEEATGKAPVLRKVTQASVNDPDVTIRIGELDRVVRDGGPPRN